MTSAVGQRHDWLYFTRKHYVSSEEVLEVYGTWVEPDEEVAKLRYHKSHTHHTIYDLKDTRAGDLNVFGQGHMLYFYFMKYMAIVFGILAVFVTFPAIIIYLCGTWYASGDVETSTIGNFGLVSSNDGSLSLGGLFAADSSISLTGIDLTGFGVTRSVAIENAIAQLFRADGDKPSVSMHSLGGSKRDAITAMSVMDLLGVLGFYGFSLYFIIWTRKLAAVANASTVTISDYSVRVRNLPKDVSDTELRKYFEQWGEVAQVDFAFVCSDLMDMVMERQDTLAKKERALAVLQRTAAAFPQVDENLEFDMLNYQYDLSLINRAIRNQQRMYASANVVEAFVVFKEEASKNKCLEMQPTSIWRRWSLPEEERFREKHVLLVEVAPEPSDLKYENLEYTKRMRVLFWIISWMLKALLLLVGFALVSAAPAIKSKLGAWKGGPDVADCNQYCTYDSSSGVPSLNATLRDNYKSCHLLGVLPNQISCGNLTICYQCYCRMVLTASMFAEAEYCSEYKSVLYLHYGSQALTVASIVIVNLCLPLIINSLSEREKHPTRSSEARSTTRALLIMFFLNSAVSIILANAYLPNVRQSLDGTSTSGWIFLGIYSDLTPNWYTDVGRALIFSQLFGIVSKLAFVGFFILKRRYQMRNKWKCFTQRELNSAYDGPEFTLSDKYGEHLGVVFVALLFSSAMPVMYWISFASFLCMFWMEKWFLLKTCRWPINYSADLAMYVSEALPFAALYHLAFALWAFSFIAVPRSAVAQGSLMGIVSSFASALEQLWTNTSGMTPQQVASRLAQGNAFHFFAFFWLCAIGLFLFLTLDAWIQVMQPFFRWLLSLFKHGRVSPDPKADRSAGSDADAAATALEYAKVRGPPSEVSHSSEYEPEVLKRVPAQSETQFSQCSPLLGVPEFDIAVRSKLLIGPASYNIRAVSIYEEAFADIEEENPEEIAALEKRLGEQGEQGGFAKLMGMKRNALRKRAADLAKEDLTKPLTRAVLENKGYNQEDRYHQEPSDASPEPSPPQLPPREEEVADDGSADASQPEPGWQVVNAATKEGEKKKRKKRKSKAGRGEESQGVGPDVTTLHAIQVGDHEVNGVRSNASVNADALSFVDADVYGRL